MSNETALFLLPELFLIVVATIIYIAGTLAHVRWIWSWLAVLGLIGAAGLLSYVVGSPHLAKVDGPVSADALGTFGRGLSLAVGVFFILTSARTASTSQSPEFFGTLLMLIVGMMITSVARDTILLFLGLELITIPTYVLLYLARPPHSPDLLTEESTAKYFFLSIFSAAILLYGLSFLYGATGETRLDKIYAILASPAGAMTSKVAMAKLALLFVFAGLGFKVTAVPFHFYAPDVYQGTSNAMAGILSVAPKVAGFIAIARVIAWSMPGVEFYAWRVALIIAILTMTVGNILALLQDNIRRLLAYSSIAHSGYMLIGVTVALAASETERAGGSIGQIEPLAGTFFYLAVYSVATIGIFAALTFLGKQDQQIDGVDELAGLSITQPVIAISLAVFLFSLAGLPPLAGFWGKFALFFAALEVDGTTGIAAQLRDWSLILAIVGGLNAAIAAAYYLRVISVMFFRAPVGQPANQGGGGALLTTLACSLAVVLLGVFPRQLTDFSQQATIAGREAIAAQTTEPPVQISQVRK